MQTMQTMQTSLMPLAISGGQIAIIAIAALIGLAGMGLMAANIAPLLRRAIEQKLGGPDGPRPLIGPPQQLTRRKFFGRTLLLGFGGAMTSFGGISLAFLWPNLRGGFGGKVVLSAEASEILAEISATKKPFYYAPGRFYLIPYDDDSPKASTYKKEGVVSSGMMALYQRCPHLGCRVPFCELSQWFECPCHGSKYNKAGEYKLGPAPRGLDRFGITVEEGIVTVDTGLIVTGPPRGTNTTGQEKEGPFCVDPIQPRH